MAERIGPNADGTNQSPPSGAQAPALPVDAIEALIRHRREDVQTARDVAEPDATDEEGLRELLADADAAESQLTALQQTGEVGLEALVELDQIRRLLDEPEEEPQIVEAVRRLIKLHSSNGAGSGVEAIRACLLWLRRSLGNSTAPDTYENVAESDAIADDIEQAEAELTALLAAVEEGRKDTERLDWMHRTVKRAGYGHGLDIYEPGVGGGVCLRRNALSDALVQVHHAKHLREAIDAARTPDPAREDDNG